MLNNLRVNDEQLTFNDIRQLENADQIAHFFAKLGYDVDVRRTIPLETTTYATSPDLKVQVRRHELIATDSVDGDIRIYLFEVRSVTAKLRNELARGFSKTNDTKVLLVLTDDYEEFEFVYLERSAPQKTKRKGLNLKVLVRPIPLAINRLKRDQLALRVLKRFTFTEADSDYQWEKLRSAYMLAEWSEEYFNNRALFSDYYLKERLTDEQITPQWKEDVRPIGKEVFAHLASARTKYSGKPEAVIRQGLFEPLFKKLGFEFVANTPASVLGEQADYLLYDPNNKQQPIAAALTYVWNRNLDDLDESRDSGTPDDIPGAIVVSLLEKQVAPWVIVTNGKLWRLYSSTASNKATNYYEIDLEEAIAATEQITALKYWWLFFRREAFTGFLDDLLKNSADYAKELGDRLKDRVFVEIFPQFAKGFIGDMRAKGLSEAQIDLETVFSGTMTFLYRLMFVLYAESLELLPINDVRGFQALSLYRMKREIANVGGAIRDEVFDKLSKHYSLQSIDLYKRLSELFSVIDSGSDALNMPTYNGGLFSNQTESGRFLEQYAIPDRYLALGLDRLTRDIDSKSQELVFIDFKSLGVRQLGSIYEGLLEFKLKIAAEALAVTKEKGKEVYQPANKVKKPLAILDKGDVYLENDKRERKATGSYYTPDYIVKYIVKHTVGPVLDRKFEKLRTRLHQAQKGYRDYVKQVEARRKQLGKEESPAVYWNKPEMQQLVDDCLNVRVLDPAMGSGHFLVEVVDYISNRLIDFLNGWSENPVWHFIDQTRQDILDDMERQHVNIDAERLTRVALLKRAVLKRCIYGVDLNAMAVELAKVSLWLDAFTLGAPLSFLDHHLKHGNSLIGARIADVQKALEGQQSLFSQNKFAGVMLATDLMRRVSYLSDNTVAQTRQSAQAYRDASDHLAPYKRMLDVYTSRWFGNTPVKGKKGKPDFDPTVEFLQHDETQAWLENPDDPKLVLTSTGQLDAAKVAKIALHAAETKRFFHWELEFPEVFFAPSTPGGQDIQLNPNGGFDAVVGNPPYLRIQVSDKETSNYFLSLYQAATGSYDIYANFVEKSLSLLTPSGFNGFILPHKFFQSDYGDGLRKVISGGMHLSKIIHFGDKQIFEGATTYVCLLILSKKGKPTFELIRVDQINSWIKDGDINAQVISAPIKDGDGWTFVTESTMALMSKLASQSVTLGEIAERIYQGVITSADNVYLFEKFRNTNDPKITQVYSRTLQQWISLETRILKSVIRSTSVDRYEAIPTVLMLFPYVVDSGRATLLDDKELQQDFPLTWKYLFVHQELLAQREGGKFNDSQFYRFGRTQNLALWEQQKIVLPYMINRLSSYNDDTNNYYFVNVTTGGYGLTKRNEWANLSYKFLCCMLNSSLLDFYLKQVSTNFRGGYFAAGKQYIEQLPIRRIDFTTPANERVQLTKQIINAYDIADNEGVLAQVQDVLSANQSDVVHDLLAHLAQQMIDLNKSKQAELKRFLSWLEGKLHIKPKNDGSTGIDSLTGKTNIQGYLGDYQKGEDAISWDDFYYRLHQNRNRFAVSLNEIMGEIQSEYEKSLATLLPIKKELARTDALIDKIVYRLYGLTDAEIELIERPQYEQALSEAKAQVVKDEQLSDDEKADKIAQNVLPAARRFLERINTHELEAKLDAELPNWRNLPAEAQTFLLTGDYNLRSLPKHMDFSTSIVSYSKVIEVVMYERVFEPFRQRYSDADAKNSFFKEFMQGKRKLTLGNYSFILPSSSETSLRNFVTKLVTNLQALTDAFKDKTKVDLRNKAAHAEVLSRDEALQIREWAIGILALF